MMQRALGRVLVVDGHPEISNLVAKFLRRRGYEVRATTTADAALEFIQADPPDIVLLDVASPAINGLDILEQILGQMLGVAVITMAGADDEDAARKSLQLGATDFIVKPLDLRYLETAVLAKLTVSRV